MDNPETLSKLDTKNTGRRQTKQNQKKNKKSKTNTIQKRKRITNTDPSRKRRLSQVLAKSNLVDFHILI